MMISFDIITFLCLLLGHPDFGIRNIVTQMLVKSGYARNYPHDYPSRDFKLRRIAEKTTDPEIRMRIDHILSHRYYNWYWSIPKK